MKMKMRQHCHWKTMGLLGCMLSFGIAAHGQFFNWTNQPPATIFATDPTALEGTSSGAFTLIRTGQDSSNALTVDLTISGTASNGVDYATISNVVTIPAGSLAVDIPVLPIVVNTGNKTVVLSVGTNNTFFAYGRKAVVEIIDDTFNIPQPTVNLVSPTNGSVFGSPATITLQATASDPDVTISSVSFYANDEFLGKTTNSPYSLTWTNARPGRFAVFARAVDQVGQSAISAAAHITLTNTSGMSVMLPTGQAAK
jgi:Bacterial Ig domain